MKRKSVLVVVAVCTFVGSLLFFPSLVAEEVGTCPHDAATSKAVSGCCGPITLHTIKVICVSGSGQACGASTCQCRPSDPHNYEEPI